MGDRQVSEQRAALALDLLLEPPHFHGPQLFDFCQVFGARTGQAEGLGIFVRRLDLIAIGHLDVEGRPLRLAQASRHQLAADVGHQAAVVAQQPHHPFHFLLERGAVLLGKLHEVLDALRHVSQLPGSQRAPQVFGTPGDQVDRRGQRGHHFRRVEPIVKQVPEPQRAHRLTGQVADHVIDGLLNLLTGLLRIAVELELADTDFDVLELLAHVDADLLGEDLDALPNAVHSHVERAIHLRLDGAPLGPALVAPEPAALLLHVGPAAAVEPAEAVGSRDAGTLHLRCAAPEGFAEQRRAGEDGRRLVAHAEHAANLVQRHAVQHQRRRQTTGHQVAAEQEVALVLILKAEPILVGAVRHLHSGHNQRGPRHEARH